MGAPEIEAFLVYLAQERHVAASTHTCHGGRCQGNQALSALLFLYKNVLQQEVAAPFASGRAAHPKRAKPAACPVVFTGSAAARVGRRFIFLWC